MKTIMICNFTLTTMGKINTDNLRSAGQDVEKSELSSIVGGIVKWYSDLENSLAVHQKVKHRIYCMSRFQVYKKENNNIKCQ